ncbi:MAG TPA: integrase arm-type DNA-binding domain-containing protein [Stellaceae bacterium]|nr:integrase arm-type DNA-binding domain-containing protein [Stellaceae bacterium]
MPRHAKPLTAQQVKGLGPGLHADGGKLYLHVSNTGARSWIFRFHAQDGRRRDYGIGSTADYSLLQAREKATELRHKVKEGTDPIEQRRTETNSQKISRATFGDVALRYIESQQAGWSRHTYNEWRDKFRLHVFPKMGKLAVAEIDTDHVLAVIKPIWAGQGPALRSRIETVLGYAESQKLRSGDNPARWTGHLKFHLPSPTKVREIKHHAALAYSELPALVHQLRAASNSKADALEFAILTCARIGEVLGATWAEIDFQGGTWTVPAERMKTRKKHVVPITAPAFAILERQKRRNDSDYIFVGDRGKPMPNSVIRQFLKPLRAGITVHGFRSTFRDWAADYRKDRDLAELSLSHSVGDAVEQSYRRTEMLGLRRALLTEWAAHCTG